MYHWSTDVVEISCNNFQFQEVAHANLKDTSVCNFEKRKHLKSVSIGVFYIKSIETIFNKTYS